MKVGTVAAVLWTCAAGLAAQAAAQQNGAGENAASSLIAVSGCIGRPTTAGDSFILTKVTLEPPPVGANGASFLAAAAGRTAPYVGTVLQNPPAWMFRALPPPAPPVPTSAAPIATTGAPIATAGAPIARTAAPVATAGAPVATAIAPVPTSGALIATAPTPVATSAAPIARATAPTPPSGAPIARTADAAGEAFGLPTPPTPTAFRLTGVDLSPFAGQRVVIVGTFVSAPTVAAVSGEIAAGGVAADAAADTSGVIGPPPVPRGPNQKAVLPELRPQFITPLAKACP